MQAQLVATGSRNCTGPELLNAIQASYRDGLDRPLLVPNCYLHWYSSDAICALLKGVGGLLLGVDSLSRHVTQAIYSLLLGNPGNATTFVADMFKTDPGYHPCTCDWAYNDGHFTTACERSACPANPSAPVNRFCRHYNLASLGKWSVDQIRKHLPGFCPAWDRNYIEWYYDLGHLRGQVKQRVSFVLGGLHFSRLDEAALEQLLKIRSLMRSNYTLICSMLPAPGKRKLPQFQEKFGMKRTVEWNKLMLRTCSRANEHVFDAFTPTVNATSFDGVHYLAHANLVLAQLLLNYIAALKLEWQ
eukprot:CAMPEP_0174358838 /NCGR_PEP_ID=MMETSP0811_2-20130205/44918_1 /TAXON_ID=73025 ORGANISM="Eutreptiella gymnastica-like, Strain CCMP1594" /NCGR_SAMPLE_ID=MMETSP0811_2 /ASSEMBLY_ACC=CAM_ASM_000667 /LENGTH=301 /DNA_ID=CAMNT_0015492955 /DNA_START=134 /DNA_END=1039 /DNA_ORIENTATION=+